MGGESVYADVCITLNTWLPSQAIAGLYSPLLNVFIIGVCHLTLAQWVALLSTPPGLRVRLFREVFMLSMRAGLVI